MESLVHHRSHSFPHRARVHHRARFQSPRCQDPSRRRGEQLAKEQVQSQQTIELGDLDVATKQLAVDLVMFIRKIHLQL